MQKVPNQPVGKFVSRLVSHAEEARQLARLHIGKSQAKDKSRYDGIHRPVSYQIDELVWVFKLVCLKKLLKRYFGPFRVKNKLPDVTYEVEPCEPSRRKINFKEVVHEAIQRSRSSIRPI
ncbi:hypothetical protein JTE90_027728 [Oedothorax gibbosus]|uniref:Reverse transcriptase n=1 Tax=Oedothorax gibbosus TaxID=931172 RepID=A0AAV6UHF4_9ARAC|nr:hypothetical protein JTE90_027728 [Oedothorax gibbosus]